MRLTTHTLATRLVTLALVPGERACACLMCHRINDPSGRVVVLYVDLERVATLCESCASIDEGDR